MIFEIHVGNVSGFFNNGKYTPCITADFLVPSSVFSKRPKERERYYLFPGQGGRNFRRKQWFILGWTVVAALILGLGLSLVIWWLSRPMH
jgi:hypothetical protein